MKNLASPIVVGHCASWGKNLVQEKQLKAYAYVNNTETYIILSENLHVPFIHSWWYRVMHTATKSKQVSATLFCSGTCHKF